MPDSYFWPPDSPPPPGSAHVRPPFWRRTQLRMVRLAWELPSLGFVLYALLRVNEGRIEYAEIYILVLFLIFYAAFRLLITPIEQVGPLYRYLAAVMMTIIVASILIVEAYAARAKWYRNSVLGERIAAVVEGSPDAIMVVNERNEIVQFNEAAQKLTGYTHAEAMGHSVALLLPLELGAAHRSRFAEAVRSMGPQDAGWFHMGARRYPLRRKDGSTLMVRAHVFGVRYKDKIDFFGVLTRDDPAP